MGEHLLQSKLPMSKLPSEKEALWRAQRELREEAAGNYDTAFEHLDRYGKEYMRLNEGSHAWTTVDKDGSFESFFISFKVRASEASAKERARKQNTESSGQRLHLGRFGCPFAGSRPRGCARLAGLCGTPVAQGKPGDCDERSEHKRARKPKYC